jgi:hypothetical protein
MITGRPLHLTPMTEDPSMVTRWAITDITVQGQAKKGMIDTGATHTVIPLALAKDLGLEQLATGRKFLVRDSPGNQSKEIDVPRYLADIRIIDVGTWRNHAVFAEDHPYMELGLFDVFIGNDILADCRFRVDGPAATFDLLPARPGYPLSPLGG